MAQLQDMIEQDSKYKMQINSNEFVDPIFLLEFVILLQLHENTKWVGCQLAREIITKKTRKFISHSS